MDIIATGIVRRQINILGLIALCSDNTELFEGSWFLR